LTGGQYQELRDAQLVSVLGRGLPCRPLMLNLQNKFCSFRPLRRNSASMG
jgi:hypothetical protein